MTIGVVTLSKYLPVLFITQGLAVQSMTGTETLNAGYTRNTLHFLFSDKCFLLCCVNG
uniref:Uncharacterized protein n=1 Tax=Anguilla anguilla TaxID=7936 RepID=A0A0E9XYD9_ANGAN